VSLKFFEGLGKSPSLDVFYKKSIRSLIEFKYPLAKEWTIRKLMLPYTFFLCLFSFYLSVVQPNMKAGDSTYIRLDPILKVIIVLFALYFLHKAYLQIRPYLRHIYSRIRGADEASRDNEAPEIIYEEFDPLKMDAQESAAPPQFSIIHTIDFLTPLMLLLVIACDLMTFRQTSSYEPALYSLIAFFMFVKFMLFFRIF